MPTNLFWLIRAIEAPRESLDDVSYYDTVTDLRLETTRGDEEGASQLHVHVQEDANEIVAYPHTASLDHIYCPRFPESEIEMVSHVSGCNFRVRARPHKELLIRKHIPGPISVHRWRRGTQTGIPYTAEESL
jgi:hypothetical protein